MNKTFRFALFVFAFALNSQAFSEKVIFDTDMAIDDWSALLLLAKHPKVDLVAVTANGAGETHCDPAMLNIPALLDLTPQQNVAIACGDDFPMDGFFTFPDPWRTQADTLSGVPLPKSSRTTSSIHAVELIHQILDKSSEPITLLTTGSLTNIAQLIQKYPKDLSKVKRLVIMGGSVYAKGNIIVPNFTDGHPNTKAEWNIYVDALAADIVFAAGLPIELVGLDATNLVKVTTAFAKEFKSKASTPAAVFWDKVLDDNDWFIDSGEYYFWDVLAALVVIDPSFCVGEMHSAFVTVKPIDKATKWSDMRVPDELADGSRRQHFDPATTGIISLGGDYAPIKICLDSNADKAFELFIKTMNL